MHCQVYKSLPERATAGAWGAVYGELLTFDDPESRLPAIDRLEGFRPGGSSLYRRVLVPVTVNGARELAWVLHRRDGRHQTPRDRVRSLAGVAAAPSRTLPSRMTGSPHPT